MNDQWTYQHWLMLANLILYIECEPLEDAFRCSRCGNGIPVCADLPGGYHEWHQWACSGFESHMPICWVCERELFSE